MNFRFFILFAILVSPGEVSFQTLKVEKSDRKLASIKKIDIAKSIQNKDVEIESPDDKFSHRIENLLESDVFQVQVDADIEHGNYISHEDTRSKFEKTKLELKTYLGWGENDSGFLESFDGFDDEESVDISREIAKYRYSSDEKERSEIINNFIDHQDYLEPFSKSDELINCETGKIIRNIGNVAVAFRPYNISIDPFESNRFDGEMLYKNNKLTDYSKRTGNIRGVMYAWVYYQDLGNYSESNNSTLFQTCELTLSL